MLILPRSCCRASAPPQRPPEVAVGVGLLGIEGGVHPLQRDKNRGSWDEIDEILGFLWDDYGMMMGFLWDASSDTAGRRVCG